MLFYPQQNASGQSPPCLRLNNQHEGMLPAQNTQFASPVMSSPVNPYAHYQTQYVNTAPAQIQPVNTAMSAANNQMSNDQKLKERCCKFLRYLIMYSNRDGRGLQCHVLNLIQELINGALQVEEFCIKLEKLLSSPSQSYLCDFLTKAIPHVRLALAMKECFIEGIVPPPIHDVYVMNCGPNQSLPLKKTEMLHNIVSNGHGDKYVESSISRAQNTVPNYPYQPTKFLGHAIPQSQNITPNYPYQQAKAVENTVSQAQSTNYGYLQTMPNCAKNINSFNQHAQYDSPYRMQVQSAGRPARQDVQAQANVFSTVQPSQPAKSTDVNANGGYKNVFETQMIQSKYLNHQYPIVPSYHASQRSVQHNNFQQYPYGVPNSQNFQPVPQQPSIPKPEPQQRSHVLAQKRPTDSQEVEEVASPSRQSVIKTVQQVCWARQASILAQKPQLMTKNPSCPNKFVSKEIEQRYYANASNAHQPMVQTPVKVERNSNETSTIKTLDIEGRVVSSPGGSSVAISPTKPARGKAPSPEKFAADNDINDVAALGGVDIEEESKKILFSAKLVGAKIRSCVDRTLLPYGPLQRRIKELCSRHKLLEPGRDVATLISHAVEERLKNLVERLSVVSEHRTDFDKNDPRYEVTVDVQKQLKFLQTAEKLQSEKNEGEEKKTCMQLLKSRTRDPEKAKLKEKAMEIHRQEMQEIKERETNLAVLRALGPRKKIKLDSSCQNTSGSYSKLQATRGKNLFERSRFKKVNLRDLIFVLEQDKEMRHSKLLYKLYLK